MVKSGGSTTTKNKEEAREESQKVGSVFMKSTRSPVKGFIKAVRPAPGGDYYHQVRVRTDLGKSGGKTGASDPWLPLIEDPAVIALLYGDKDMILNSRCRIEYTEASSRTGRVFIEYDPRRQKIARKNATEFESKAFLYAAAGSGKLL